MMEDVLRRVTSNRQRFGVRIDYKWALFFFFGDPAKGAGIQERARIYTGRQHAQVRRMPTQVGKRSAQAEIKLTQVERAAYPGFEPWAVM